MSETDLVAAPKFVGHAARAVGVSTKRIRYYQRLGLLPDRRSCPGTYRVLTDADVRRLQVIGDLRALAVPAAQIKALLAEWDAGHPGGASRALARALRERRSAIVRLEARLGREAA